MDINGMAKSIKLIVKELAEYTAYTGLLRIDGVDAVREAYDNIDELVRLAEVGQAITEAFDNDCMLQVDDLYCIKHIEALIELKNSGKWKGFKDE